MPNGKEVKEKFSFTITSKIHLKTLCHMSLKEMKLYLKLRESHYENFGLFSYESEKVRARGFRMHNPFNIQFIRAVYVTLYRYHLHCFFWLYGIPPFEMSLLESAVIGKTV